MKVDAYLKRIGCLNVRKAPTLKTLSHLQHQHLLSVPFENLDIRRGQSIHLDLPSIYNKVVENMRGGFCYELNSLYAWLLQELGFTVHLLSARVVTSEGSLGPEFDHLTLMVELDQPYLTDVGFGDSSRVPLPFSGESHSCVSGRYRVVPLAEKNIFALQKADKEEGWKDQYLYTTIPRKLQDFSVMCQHHQTSPDSHFTQKSICSLATETGRISLSDDHLIITEGGEKRNIPFHSPTEKAKWLRKAFKIML